MNTALVLVTIFAFILIDLIIRFVLHRIKQRNLEKERQEALDIGLNLDISETTPSLKRVELKNPVARLLAVDDEEVVLDSFRKILVMGGYNVDTVETGQEALKLVQEGRYDFVFTDLKMPAMSGVDVVKGVHHLRPDIDIVVITGYASVDTAVDCMKYGAVDYVEKPFTGDELLEFTKRSLIRRQERIESEAGKDGGDA